METSGNFTFHSVGQGLFYSGTINIDESSRRKHTDYIDLILDFEDVVSNEKIQHVIMLTDQEGDGAPVAFEDFGKSWEYVYDCAGREQKTFPCLWFCNEYQSVRYEITTDKEWDILGRGL